MTNSIKAGITAVVLSLGLATPIAAEPPEDGTAAYRSGDYWNAMQLWQQFEDGFSAYRRGDYAAAIGIFRPLAEQGNARAQWYLGAMYLFGDGVPQNDAEAMKWYLQAAKKDYALAQSGLGMIYKRGYGVPQNYILAYMWYTVAAHDPNAESAQQDHLAEIAPHVTPSQIAEARRLARQCLQSHYAHCHQTPEVRSANWPSAVDFADSPTRA